MKKLSIKTIEEILRLRSFLQQISSISFTFSKVNQDYPIEHITEEEGQEVIQVYKNLLRDAEVVVQTFKNLNLNNNYGKQQSNK